MAWRLGRGSDGQEAALEVYSTGSGLVVQGQVSDVAAFIDGMKELTQSSGGRGRHLIADLAVPGAQVAANVAALAQTHREYFEFSERALALIKEHGVIPAKDGWFRSFVHNGKHLAGNLDWKPVDLSPEQALSMQAIAGQMALRAAIKDVVAAIERVEAKVDQIVDLVRAERLGAVAGDRATLMPMVERLHSTGELSDTDWATVAALGPTIARDIESLRSYIVQQLKKVGDSSRVRSRASDAENLADNLVNESFALLVVAEQNYVLWQQLRIGRSAVHERSALKSVTADVRRQLVALTQADQALLAHLSAAIAQLTTPTGFEGLAPLKKRKLREHAEDLAQLGSWFGEQRHLDYDMETLPDYPRLGESLTKVGQTVSTTIRSVREGRQAPDEPAALPTADVHGKRENMGDKA